MGSRKWKAESPEGTNRKDAPLDYAQDERKREGVREMAILSAAPSDWAGKLARYSVVYFCVCGLVVLALDLLAARARGEFVIASPASYALMRYMMPVGVQ